MYAKAILLDLSSLVDVFILATCCLSLFSTVIPGMYPAYNPAQTECGHLTLHSPHVSWKSTGVLLRESPNQVVLGDHTEQTGGLVGMILSVCFVKQCHPNIFNNLLNLGGTPQNRIYS